MEVNSINYCVNKPYPSVEQLDMNVAYGQMMLSNLGGLHSEMNAVSLYFYNHVITKQSWPKLAKVMQEISFVEMHHLEIFADMCTHLAVDPRLWDCQNDFLEYWSPGYNVYPRQMNIMLENAIKEEPFLETKYFPPLFKLHFSVSFTSSYPSDRSSSFIVSTA